jgi:hypothetical protein
MVKTYKTMDNLNDTGKGKTEANNLTGIQLLGHLLLQIKTPKPS